VPFISLTRCSSIFKRSIWNGTLCAGGRAPVYADSCYGDSGGPLVANATKDPSTHRLAGLVSYGYMCANEHPGVYTDIRRHRQWIDNNVILHNAGGTLPPPVRCSYHVGHAYASASGQNWTVLGVEVPGECCNICKVNSSCTAWSWHGQTKRCVLLKKLAKREYSRGWMSGNVTKLEGTRVAACEMEYYVRYSDPKRTQLLRRYNSTAVKTAADCCVACRANKDCRNMSFETQKQVCELFKGPSSKVGWARQPWEYNYISALVVRKASNRAVG
jgi:hypothetical protein